MLRSATDEGGILCLRHGGDDARAGSDEVGLGMTVKARRAFGRIIGNEIVGALDGRARIGCADGDDERVIGRAGDAAVGQLVDGLANRIVADDRCRAAIISGAAHDDDACADGALDGLAHRVCLVGFVDRAAEAHVHDADVEAILVSDGPVDGVQRAAGAADAVFVNDAQVNEVGFRRDADVVFSVAFGGCAVSGCHAGDASAVAVSVARARAAREVDGGEDARFVLVLVKVRVIADAAVNDGNRDALAGEAGGARQTGLHLRCPGGVGRHALRFKLTVGRDVGHICATGQRREAAIGNVRHYRIERVVAAARRAARARNRVLRCLRAAFGLDDDAHAAGVAAGRAARRAAFGVAFGGSRSGGRLKGAEQFGRELAWGFYLPFGDGVAAGCESGQGGERD